MRPIGLKTKIFLDSGDPKETAEALSLLGFLDGQTTNPSLIANNPAAAGKKFSTTEILNFYRGVVKEVSSLIPQGSVSIEVYSDKNTLAAEMLKQAKEFYTWIPNAHIKFPTTIEGLKATEQAVKAGMRVNMTLVFSQEQAAAVYVATLLRQGYGGQAKGASRGQVYLSPFIGRLDDRGELGMDLIKNIISMYKQGDGHVEVLTASVRSLEHFTKAIELGSDIITAPLKIIREWAGQGMEVKYQELSIKNQDLKPILYQDISLNKAWQDYNLGHELTDKGLEKFAADWRSLIIE